MSGILVFVVMLVPSYLVWKLIHATVFRATGDSDRTVLVATIFAVTMALTGVTLGLGSLVVYHKDLTPDDWLFWPAAYCVSAAALIGVGLVLKAFGFAFEGLIAAIRGD